MYKKIKPKYEKGSWIEDNAGAIGAGANLLGNFIPTDSQAGKTTSGILKGVSAGAALGPWGMAGGAALGAITSLIGAKGERIEKQRQGKLTANTNINNMTAMNTAGYNFNGVNTNYYSRGGKIKYAKGNTIDLAEGDYEVENGEVVQGQDAILEESTKLASDLQLAGGEKHEQGGTDGKGGERVYSDRLKLDKPMADLFKSYGVKGRPTYANAAKMVAKDKGKAEAKLKSKIAPSIRTGHRMVEDATSALDLLFNLQEMSKPENQQPVQEFAEGGELPDPKQNKPVYTNNPKDPRIKKYNDSLSLYKKSTTNYSFPNTNLSGETITSINKFNKDYTAKQAANRYNIKGNILPIGYSGDSGSPIYKKPTTKIIYKKEKPLEEPKPIQLEEVKITGKRPDKVYTPAPENDFNEQRLNLTGEEKMYLKKKYGTNYTNLVTENRDVANKDLQEYRKLKMAGGGDIFKTSPIINNIAKIGNNFNTPNKNSTGQNWFQKNEGQLINGASYLANLGSINKLNTNINRTYLSTPNYNYVDRSGITRSQNLGTYRTALKGLTSSSQGVNASNAGALYAQTLGVNSQVNAQENMRKDQYDNQYGERIDRVSYGNTQIQNEASDQQTAMENEKRVSMPLQARNAFLQGYAGNTALTQRTNLDKQRMLLNAYLNDSNGVLGRIKPGDVENMMKLPIFKMFNN